MAYNFCSTIQGKRPGRINLDHSSKIIQRGMGRASMTQSSAGVTLTQIGKTGYIQKKRAYIYLQTLQLVYSKSFEVNSA